MKLIHDVRLCRGCGSALHLPNRTGVLRCPVCMTRLRGWVDPFSTSVALSCTCLLLFLMVQAFPLLDLDLQGNVKSFGTLMATWTLWQGGEHMIALLIGLTLIAAPGLEFGGIVWLGITPASGSASRKAIFRMVQTMRSWNMLEVCSLALLVAMVKLADYAEVIPGVAFYAVLLMLVVATRMNWRLDLESLADRIG